MPYIAFCLLFLQMQFLPPFSPSAVFKSFPIPPERLAFPLPSLLEADALAAAADADAFAEEADAKSKEVVLRISIPFTHLFVHTHTIRGHTHTMRLPYTNLFVHLHTTHITCCYGSAATSSYFFFVVAPPHKPPLDMHVAQPRGKPTHSVQTPESYSQSSATVFQSLSYARFKSTHVPST